MIMEYKCYFMTAKGEIWDYVMSRAPALQKLVNDFWDMTLWDYANLRYSFSGSLNEMRRVEFLKYTWDYIEKKHWKTIRENAIQSLMSNYCVSTADHHGPIGHPFFFQSAVLRWLTRPWEAIVNLCTSHVSLGNSSYPRGFVVHNKREPYLWLPFFSAKERMSPVFGHAGFKKKDVEKCLSVLSKHQSLFENSDYHSIKSWLQKNALSELILWKETYSEQITTLNELLWNDIFGANLPPLITLDGEKIVSELLCQHLKKETSLLKNIMTELSWQEEIENYFDGVSCCFEKKNRNWTYLFWHINADGERRALWRNNNTLNSEDATISVSLNAEALHKALKNGELIPSGLLMYTTLACYYGLTCFGGFAQGTYLPRIFAAYEKLAHKMWESVQIQTSILCEDMVLMRNEKGGIITALDMLLAKEECGIEKLLRNAKSTTLSDSIYMMLPEIARCL